MNHLQSKERPSLLSKEIEERERDLGHQMSEEMTSTQGQREDLVHQDNDQGLQGQGQGSNHKEAGVNPLSGGKLKFNEKKPNINICFEKLSTCI